MTPDPASLDRLHDVVLPASVRWWPLAPGWYAVLALLALAGAWLAWRSWKHRQANAYRRAALRELAAQRNVSAIAELLRRTALVIAPRPVIAGLTGAAWTEWLDTRCSETMPEIVRTQLIGGVYGCGTAHEELDELRHYAARWIAHHDAASTNTRRPR